MMVGRCADYALSDYPNCVSVFIYADLESKVKRIMNKYDLSEAKAKEKIIKTDKKARQLLQLLFQQKVGEATSYNLCIDSSVCGIDNTVQLIKSSWN